MKAIKRFEGVRKAQKALPAGAGEGVGRRGGMGPSAASPEDPIYASVDPNSCCQLEYM